MKDNMTGEDIDKLLHDEMTVIRSVVSQHRRHMFAMVMTEDADGVIHTSHVATDFTPDEPVESECCEMSRKRRFISAAVSLIVIELGEVPEGFP